MAEDWVFPLFKEFGNSYGTWMVRAESGKLQGRCLSQSEREQFRCSTLLAMSCTYTARRRLSIEPSGRENQEKERTNPLKKFN